METLLVPLSFIQGSGQERIILSTFGLDTKGRCQQNACCYEKEMNSYSFMTILRIKKPING